MHKRHRSPVRFRKKGAVIPFGSRMMIQNKKALDKRTFFLLYLTKPMSKSSSLFPSYQESRGWCDHGKEKKDEWTCEGNPNPLWQ